MKENIVFKNEKDKTAARDAVLKVTSLLYLKEALFNEKYEDCKELIRIAKRFGARQGDIRSVITVSNRGVMVGRGNEANKGKGGRLRF
jgi:hypothetical protein